jgi:nucleotide-binding universal stress UspA family protein
MSGFRLGTTLVALTGEWLSGRTTAGTVPGTRAQSTTAGDATLHARRLLAVLECRSSDDAVRERAVDLALRSGGYLTLLAVVPRPFPCVGAGPYCVPRVSADELRAQAAATIARAVALVPPEIPLLTALEEGKPAEIVRRRVVTAAHDVVVARCRLRLGRAVTVPVVPC